MSPLEAALTAARVVPIVRTADADGAARLVSALAGAGATVVELTATIPGWEGVLRSAATDHPDVVLGLGTVTAPEQARAAVDAGAAFLVSPWLVPAVREAAGETPLLEGALTPRELAVAAAANGGLAKLFPAHAAGPRYLRSVRAVLPELRAVPTGGIPPEEIGAWLEAGAIAVGLGSELSRAADPAAAFAAARARALAG